jgi:hypothetical protein
MAFLVCVLGYAAGTTAAAAWPFHHKHPRPTIPCFEQTIDGQDGHGIIIVDCSLSKTVPIETPAPAGNTFRHGAWIQHVGGAHDGTYSFRP